MKKYFAIICLAMAATACNKEMIPSENQLDDNIRTVTLSAHLPDTKVSVASDGKVTWSSEDEIAVYNTEGEKFIFTIKDGVGTSNATFNCSTFDGTLSDIAVYPAEWAGAKPGEIVIPEYIERSDNIPAVMASTINSGDSGDDHEIAPLYFKSLMFIMEFNLKNLPAYACAFKLWSEKGAQLNGTYKINSSRDALELDLDHVENTSQIIYFPYKTAYGSDATVKVYAAIPAYEYTDLRIGVLDGDESVIEGTSKRIHARSFEGQSADAYITMPELDIRSLVGDNRKDFIKVEGVKWAKGNLRVWQSGTDGAGWQVGWNIYDNQWESQYLLIAADNKKLDGTSENFTLNNALYKEGNFYTHWDYFSWGTLSRTSRVYNAPITSSVSNFEISGKVFSLPNKKGDIAKDATELSGEDRWEDVGSFQNTNSPLAGDLAFWASKGQYRLPTKNEINKLYAKNYAGAGSNYAHMQAGYYIVDGKRVNGILFTSCPSWETTKYNTTAIKLSSEDMESGLFLPKIGERNKNTNPASYDATTVNYFNSWGAYWSGTYGGLKEGFEDCAVHIFFTTANAMNYGYTNSPSNSISGQTILGNAIRPVYIPENERN